MNKLPARALVAMPAPDGGCPPRLGGCYSQSLCQWAQATVGNLLERPTQHRRAVHLEALHARTVNIGIWLSSVLRKIIKAKQTRYTIKQAGEFTIV